MFCYKCGKQLPDGAKFCKYCGTSLGEVKKNNVPEGKVHEPVQSSGPVYEKTEIISESSEDDTQMLVPGSEQMPATEILDTGTNKDMTPSIVPVYKNEELKVKTERPKKRWPLVVLLLLIIFLSLGVLGALFIFPDQVEEFVDRLTGRSTATYVDEDSEKEDEEDLEAAEGEESIEGKGSAEGEGEAEAEEEGTEWGRAYAEAIDAVSRNTWPLFSMTDLNGDGTPEIIGRKNAGMPGRMIMTYSADNGVSSVTTKGNFLTYSTSAGMFADTYTEGKTAYDVIYELNSKGINQIMEGSYSLDAANNFDSDGNPIMIYKADGSEVNSSAYYANIESLYFNKGVQDESKLSAVDYDAMAEILKKADPESAFNAEAKAQENGKEWKYSFLQEAQYFEAPYSGRYRFALYGANGGGDSDRDYDAEAAVLIGTMKLNAGERVIVFTGGEGGMNKYYYDKVRKKGNVVPGGYNGGGECFASGGGGGCTDIYYRGVRVAAAAGSGGGNYDEYGMAGRTSASRDHITANKLGASTPKLDIGGGGAGWFGGTIGKVDQAGYGGVNGWDGAFFTVEQEFEGAAFSMSGDRQGSALIEYVGE